MYWFNKNEQEIKLCTYVEIVYRYKYIWWEYLIKMVYSRQIYCEKYSFKLSKVLYMCEWQEVMKINGVISTLPRE